MKMRTGIFPENLEILHHREEQLRDDAVGIVGSNTRLQLHFAVIECAMDSADTLRQFPTDDEDMKVLKVLGMRIFNAFGASLKLVLSGYSQNSALIARDVLETVFLLDLFRSDRALIQRWRLSDKKAHRKLFAPVKVREALDARDGFTSKKRGELYGLFSELAGHPTMKSTLMMRPRKGGDAVIGPFIEAPMLETVLLEMGRLAVQVGESLIEFIPADWPPSGPARLAFIEAKSAWVGTFHPASTQASENASA